MNPASALQLHPSAIFCLDEEAASELTLADYYRWVLDNKPSWQVIRGGLQAGAAATSIPTPVPAATPRSSSAR